jgi:hypothetical protein
VFYATLRECPASTASASPFSMVMYLPLTQHAAFLETTQQTADGFNGQAR